MEKRKLKKMADAFVNLIKKENPQNLKLYQDMANKALGGDGNASLKIAWYYGFYHTEGKKEWLEIAAYDQNEAEAYYCLAEWYFYESFVLGKDYQETYKLIDIANKKGCRTWCDTITYILSLHDTDKAISYYEHAYFHGESRFRAEAAKGLCHVYCGLSNPKYRNKDKYDYWFNEWRKHNPTSPDLFKQNIKKVDYEIQFTMDLNDKTHVSRLLNK